MPDHFYVYPAYLDSSRPRSLGRRVPTPEGTAEVTAEEIVAAAKALGASATAEPEKQYPRTFFTYSGRVRVAKKGGLSKGPFLKQLAQEIARRRAAERKS